MILNKSFKKGMAPDHEQCRLQSNEANDIPLNAEVTLPSAHTPPANTVPRGGQTEGLCGKRLCLDLCVLTIRHTQALRDLRLLLTHAVTSAKLIRMREKRKII